MNSRLVKRSAGLGSDVAGFPTAAARLRVAIVSDAILGRNGVGTYYPDLICHLEASVDDIQLWGPNLSPDRSLEQCAIPMLGDCTQRLAFPRRGALQQRLRRQRPHVIVIPSLGPFSYVALRYAKRHRIPVALVNHTSFDHLIDLYWPGCCSRPLRAALARVQRWLIGQAGGVAAMNVESLREARQIGAPLVRVMGTPINATFLRTPIVPPRADPRHVIFVGRLAREKRLEDFLDACVNLPHIQFQVAGDGPMRQKVQAMAGRVPNLAYLGWLDRPGVLRAMDDADVLVLPSALETFGTVALEALARRRYVVVSRQCGISAWPGISGGLFYIEKQETTTTALQRLINCDRTSREDHAMQSWLAVEDFNRHTLRAWLRFLVDVAGLQTENATDSRILVSR
jgi:glycosyltransferase involved in cell wall biosynthesis